MTHEELFAATTHQRQQLLGTLDALQPAEWAVPSLCEGWTVRDVVGHLVSQLKLPTGRFVVNAVRAGGFDRYADVVAREFGDRDPSWLVAAFRILAEKRLTFPVVGPTAALFDVVVHTRDVARPLGRPSQLDETVVRPVLDHLCRTRTGALATGGAARGFRIEATDLDWECGEGPVVAGSGEALVLAFARRRETFDELKGDGADAFVERLSA